ncbi:hypothetical protein GR302_18785 [Aeromonas caviae]|nr:hypothetical protein [Aeromonas caviae]
MFVIWSHEKGFIMSHQLTFADSEFREGANKSYGTRAFTGNPLILND